MRLSDVIYKASKRHNIPSKIFTAILMQESAYKLDAKNCTSGKLVENKLVTNKKKKVCSDFGIAQIYYTTAEAYNFDENLLLTDLEYSVNAGAKVLSWFKETYAADEYYWWTRYNCGTKPSVNRKTCRKYKSDVSDWL